MLNASEKCSRNNNAAVAHQHSATNNNGNDSDTELETSTSSKCNDNECIDNTVKNLQAMVISDDEDYGK